MASAFSHAIAALALGKAMCKKQPFKLWFLGMFCAVIPDIDVISFKLGIPYEHVLGHRGITHSLAFAFLLGLVITLMFYRKEEKGSRQWWSLVFYFSLATVSHGILDAITNGGLGVAFFAPFDTSRYFFPWRPVQVSPIGAGKFFSEWGVRVLKSEFIYIWMPSFLIMGIAYIFRSRSDKPLD